MCSVVDQNSAESNCLLPSADVENVNNFAAFCVRFIDYVRTH